MWIFGKSAKVSMYSVNSEIFVLQQMERKTAKDRRKSRYICHCNCWAPVSQTENVKRKVLHGGRKSIVTSEGTCKKPSLFCLYPRSWKGAAHQSLSPWGLNSCLFTDGLHHSAVTTVLLEVCCHGRIYDMYTRTRYYYDAVKSKTKIFYTNQKRNHIFCSTKYCWCMAPENLGCCSIFDVFIRPFGQRVHIGMSYDWRITKKKKIVKTKRRKQILWNTASDCICVCVTSVWKKKREFEHVTLRKTWWMWMTWAATKHSSHTRWADDRLMSQWKSTKSGRLTGAPCARMSQHPNETWFRSTPQEVSLA